MSVTHVSNNITCGDIARGGDVHARRVDREQGAWINYRMKCSGIQQKDIAKRLGVSQQMVQRVAYGVGTSARVQKALAQALGHANWTELVATRQGVAA